MRFENRLTPMTGSHLSDDQLMEAYVLAGENRHLEICRQCKSRFDDLVRTLQQMHDAAVREADHAFSAERLHEQRDRVMRRIERHDHPAEVVAFPQHRATAHRSVHRMFGPARRWVAAAAAAGLAAGVFLGFAIDRRTHDMAIDRAVQQVSALPWQTPADPREDQFMSEIDDALMGPRAVELGAIDAMTTPVEIREASYPR